MTAWDLITSAVSNMMRAKARSLLTILAIFIGAFTLTITSGLGTGINAYIDDTVSEIGSSDMVTVTKVVANDSGGLEDHFGPAEYSPDAIQADRMGGAHGTLTALSDADIEALAQIDGVVEVAAAKAVSIDYVQHGTGTKFTATATTLLSGQQSILAAGVDADNRATQYQVAVPASYVEAFGFSDSSEVIGQSITIAVSDGALVQHEVSASVVGVTEETLMSIGGGNLILNSALTDALFIAQNTGISADQADRYAQATVWAGAAATDADIADLKTSLGAAGYTATTVDDQLGMITTVIDAIVWVLNAFAIIALLAASFGIVNTLLMSVQERTREIGIMKAMGMSSGRVFALFSLEAVAIGLLGSVIGVGGAVLVGSAISAVLAEGFLSALAGLTLIAFSPAKLITIVGAVVAIAFLAGTIPAVRAAQADPVESLRYE